MNKMDTEDKYCKICYSEASKYVCPRCGIPYCSIKCYRDVDKHLKCSEDFYRRCIQENLEAEVGNDGAKGSSDKDKADAMNQVLKRLHNQEQGGCDDNLTINSDESDVSENDEDESLDSDDDEPLAKRLGEVDLDESEKVWDLLTDDEKADFQRMVEATEAQGVEAVAEPWYPGRKLIQEVSLPQSASASSASTSSSSGRSSPPSSKKAKTASGVRFTNN